MAAEDQSEFSKSDNKFIVLTPSGDTFNLTCKFTRSKKFVQDTLCGFHSVLYGKWKLLKDLPKCCRGGFIWIILYDQHAKAKGKPLNPFCSNEEKNERIYGDVILAQRYHDEKTITGFTQKDHENIIMIDKIWTRLKL